MSRTRIQWNKILRLRTLLHIVLGLIYVVLGLTIVYPPGRSATARAKLTCPQLSAWYDLMPRALAPRQTYTGPIIYVAGKCTFPTPGFSVELKPHTPRGPDPKTLLLDAIVHAPTGIVTQVMTDVNVRYELRTTPTVYEKVIILPDNLVLTVGKAL